MTDLRGLHPMMLIDRRMGQSKTPAKTPTNEERRVAYEARRAGLGGLSLHNHLPWSWHRNK